MMINKINSTLLFLLFFTTFTVFSQNDNFNNYWNLLLKNNPKEAYTFFKENIKNYKTSLETLLENEILRKENGFINVGSKDFVKQLTTFKDFEYYIYALWTNSYLFDNYLTNGFHTKNSNVIRNINADDIDNKTIKYSLLYLKAILERDNNNFKGYYAYISKIPVIKDWQFCGVFENLNQSGLDTPYAPETNAKSKKDFNANSNGFVNWYTPHKDYTKTLS